VLILVYMLTHVCSTTLVGVAVKALERCLWELDVADLFSHAPPLHAPTPGIKALLWLCY
jgi:hypothetical protein